MKALLTFLLQCLTANIVFSQGLSLPYYTGFDSPAEKAGWQQFRTGFLSVYSWGTNAGQLYHDYNVGGNSNDTVIDWFVSPPLNFTSPGIITMKVKTGGFSTPFPDNCEIWFGTDNPNPSTGNFVLIANLSYMQPKYQWLDTTVNVSFVSDNGYIAFKYKTIGAAWMDYGIDSIWVSSPVGINEKENYYKIEVNIFPNPFSLQTTLQTNNLIIRNATLTVDNCFGQTIKQIKGISEQTITLHRDNFPSGLYFVRLTQNNKIIARDKLLITD